MQKGFTLQTSKFPNGDNTLVEFQAENVKSPGSQAWERYELYKHCKTLGEAKEAGATREDLRFGLEKGIMKVISPTNDNGSAENEIPAVELQSVPESPVSYPREVDVEPGMPDGWKCIERIYGEDSRLSGKLYKRFYSLDGRHKALSTPNQVIRIDCEEKGIDPEPVIANYLRLRNERQAASRGRDGLFQKRAPANNGFEHSERPAKSETSGRDDGAELARTMAELQSQIDGLDGMRLESVFEFLQEDAVCKNEEHFVVDLDSLDKERLEEFRCFVAMQHSADSADEHVSKKLRSEQPAP